tara:strand:+ start:175 stop:459 length:285 start_codon:yes stop_codon:yes gene_type:complete
MENKEGGSLERPEGQAIPRRVRPEGRVVKQGKPELQAGLGAVFQRRSPGEQRRSRDGGSGEIRSSRGESEGDEFAFVEGERNLALKTGSRHPER